MSVVTAGGLKWRMSIFYSTQPAGLILLTHEHRIYVSIIEAGAPGDDIGDFIVQRRNLGELGLDSYLDIYMDLIEPICPATTSFVRAELWAAVPLSEDYVFYSTLPIGHVGSGAAGGGYNSQIMTFRCQNGNSMRLQLAETSVSAGVKDPYPFANAGSAALAAHVSGTESCIINKRFFFPISPINNCVEQNEIYWDERNR